MSPAININSKEFVLVKVQREGNTAIYKHGDEYLRIGDKKKIMQDLALHKQMEAGGFPVAELLSEGVEGEQYYYIESSLGDKLFTYLFAEDVVQKGSISDENFAIFLDVVKRFAEAQIKTATPVKDFAPFTNAIHFDILCDELPEYRAKIEAYFERVKTRLVALPFVQTHGDFNPHNLFPGGVIDLEVSSFGPLGYDLVSAIASNNYFPDSEGYEFRTSFRFTQAQKEQYYTLVDSISTKAGLPPISQFAKDLEFCRAVWLLVRMQKWPKIQKYRYDLFLNKFL